MNDEYSERKSAYDTISDQKAVEKYRLDPEEALSGGGLLSVEADPDEQRADAVRVFAQECPERFLWAVEQLPQVIQDIFYQYYLLGRKQTHIGNALDLTQKQVWQTLALGLRGVATVLKGDPMPEDVLAFQRSQRSRRPKLERTPDDLGSFCISFKEADELLEHLAPMTTGGPIDVG
jgi:hypothetical protein